MRPETLEKMRRALRAHVDLPDTIRITGVCAQIFGRDTMSTDAMLGHPSFYDEDAKAGIIWTRDKLDGFVYVFALDGSPLAKGRDLL